MRFRRLLALVIALISGNTVSAATKAFFHPAVFSEDREAMNAVLGVIGHTFDDFEDTTLIDGLTIRFTGNGFTETRTTLGQTVDFLDAHWNGPSILSNDPNNAIPPANPTLPKRWRSSPALTGSPPEHSATLICEAMLRRER